VIAISEGTARYLEREFDCDGRVHVAPLGVNPERYPAELLEERAAARRPFTVGFVGAFRPYHGLETLVDAFALLRRAHPDARLLLVGDGPERPAVEAQVEGLGVADGVTFVGAVPHEEVPAQLACMDAGVAAYPADRHYLSPMKVLEYLAAGLPVVASGVDQLADLIEDGRSGLLCGPDDPDSLAAGLERLASDPALRARLGTAGRDRVLAHYTWDAFVGRILELGGLA
jgi:glycosyltransferase involved in cell wall biosynthesis